MGDLATGRAGATADFQGGMGRTILDLTVRRDTYSDEIENDKDQIYQLELELAVLEDMSERLKGRIERRYISHKEFVKTTKDAMLASKKLKAATKSLAGICKNT